jgi:hypothetical protein
MNASGQNHGKALEQTGEASFVDALIALAETVAAPEVETSDQPPRRLEAELAKKLRAALRQGGAARRAA